MLAEQHDPAFWRSLSANPEQHRKCASTRKASKHSSTQDSFGSIFRASLPITTERTAREKASALLLAADLDRGFRHQPGFLTSSWCALTAKSGAAALWQR